MRVSGWEVGVWEVRKQCPNEVGEADEEAPATKSFVGRLDAFRALRRCFPSKSFRLSPPMRFVLQEKGI